MAGESVFDVEPSSRVFQITLGFILIGGLVLLLTWVNMNKSESYYERQQPYQSPLKSSNLAADASGPPILGSKQLNNKFMIGGISYNEARSDVRRIPFESGRPG